MSGLGYSQYTIDRMDAVWKNLASYCEEHNDGLLTAESARGFVWDLYGAVLGEKDASQNVNRAVHILLDFQQFGMIFKQSHMTLKSFSDAFSPLFEGFLEKQRKDGFLRALSGHGAAGCSASSISWQTADRPVQPDRAAPPERLYRNAGRFFFRDSWRDNQAPWKAVRLCPRNGWHSRSFSGALPDVRRTHSYRLPTAVYPGGSGADTGIR